MTSFGDACVAAPAGVALLAALEARERGDVSWFESPNDSSDTAVVAAVRTVDAMAFGELCSVAVGAAERLVGPWVGDAPQSAARAYRNAESRRPIAVAIGERFHHELHAPLDGPRQQWWTTPYSADAPREPVELFRDFGDVYGNGEFTGAGFWTVTDPPADVHDDLIGVWEMFEGPISRTMEGCVSGTGDGAVTMLRYWRSERTLWLADCFGEPEPLGRPILSGHVGGVRGVSSAANMARRTNDREYLRRLLGR